MKYSEIIETMEMGKFNFEKHFPKFNMEDCTHDGRTEDTDWYTVTHANIIYYIVFYGSHQVFVCSTKYTQLNGIDYIELSQAQTYSGHTGNNYLIKLMYFLKTQKQKPLLMGDIVSSATISILKKANNTGRFSMNWLDTNTHVKTKLDNGTFSNYTSLEEPNHNRIIVESSKPIMPRYFDSSNPLSYGTMFEDLD